MEYYIYFIIIPLKMTDIIHYFPVLSKFLGERTKELSPLGESSGGCLAQTQHRANLYQVDAFFTNLFVSKEKYKTNMRQTDAVLTKQSEPTAFWSLL